MAPKSRVNWVYYGKGDFIHIRGIVSQLPSVQGTVLYWLGGLDAKIIILLKLTELEWVDLWWKFKSNSSEEKFSACQTDSPSCCLFSTLIHVYMKGYVCFHACAKLCMHACAVHWQICTTDALHGNLDLHAYAALLPPKDGAGISHYDQQSQSLLCFTQITHKCSSESVFCMNEDNMSFMQIFMLSLRRGEQLKYVLLSCWLTSFLLK